jgi:hemerythrin-like domain-containing protein
MAALGSAGTMLETARGQRKGKAAVTKAKQESEEEISPAEDLMREHGVLKRVLLVYRELIRRLEANENFSPETLRRPAMIIRQFIEDYHEKLEEDHLFPRFRKANTLVELVAVLGDQHQKGRVLTDRILRGATSAGLKDPAQRSGVKESLALFIHMYEPHEAREDTVLFPALHHIVSRSEYGALGDEFEKKEHQLFGEEGFEKYVGEVAAIEKMLGIYDLGQFTPRV